MKKLDEQIQKFRKLALLEATTTSSSGSYEQPLEFEVERPPEEEFIGLAISADAPQVDTVDITGGDIGGFEEIDTEEESEYPSEESEEEEVLTLMNTLGLGL